MSRIDKWPGKVRRRRAVAFALTFGAVIGATSACAPSGEGDGGGTVTIDFWDDSAGAIRTPIYEELISEFERANPKIKVNYLGLPQDGSALTKFNAAIAGGTTPHVASTTTGNLSALVAQNGVAQLDDMLDDSPLADSLQDAFLDIVRGAVDDGALYGVPYQGNFNLIWYRVDMFADAGLEPPETWDELLAAARELRDVQQRRYGWTLRGGEGSMDTVVAQAFSYSGIDSWFSEDGEATLAATENAEIIEKVAELYNVETPEADITNGGPEMVNQFIEGDIAMMPDTLYNAVKLKDAFGDQLGAMAFPSRESDSAHTVVMRPVPTYVMFEGIEHKDAAWKFMEFLLSKEPNSTLNESVGQIPANSDAMNDPWIESVPGLRMSIDILEDPSTNIVIPPFYLPEYGSIMTTESTPEYQKVLIGDRSASEFLQMVSDLFTEANEGSRG